MVMNTAKISDELKKMSSANKCHTRVHFVKLDRFETNRVNAREKAGCTFCGGQTNVRTNVKQVLDGQIIQTLTLQGQL